MNILSATRILLLFFGMLSFGSFAQKSKKAYQQGEFLYQNGEYREAINFFKAAVDADPENIDATFLLGDCYLKLNEAGTSLTYLMRAFELNEDCNDEIRYMLGLAMQETEKFDDAIKMFNEFLDKNKNPSDIANRETNNRINECKVAKTLIENPVKAKIDNLGPVVNTQFPDYTPVITADESVLMFTSRRDGNIGGVKEPYRNANELFDREDIYQSNKMDGKWSAPLNLGKPVNTSEHDAIVALSPDGNTMFLYKAVGEGDLYYSKKTSKSWTKPESLGSNINSKYAETSVSVTADGKTIFFSSNRPGGFGGFDIYKAERKENGRYDRPENLGPTINTSDDDDSPFIHPDGVSLYFSSKGHATMGGFDIFRTFLDSTGGWSQPENMGSPINTTKDDIYFVLSADNKHGYYSSEKAGGYGKSDCYIITMPTREIDIVAEKTEVKKFNFEQSNSGTPKMVLQVATQKTFNPITIFKGKVFDELTKQPLETEISIVDNVTGEKVSDVTSGADGSFLIVLNSGKNYGIAVVKKGYLFHSENFDLPPSSDYQEVEKEVLLKKAALGTRIVLRNIFFDFNKSTLRKESTKELERLMGILKENPTLKVEIAGHTDNVGSAEYNNKLSEDRAHTVVDYLVDNGIDKKRLTFAGYGFAKPMTTNDTEIGRQLNRRTEFEIKGI